MPKTSRHWTTPAPLPAYGYRLTPSPLYQPNIRLLSTEQAHRSPHFLTPASSIAIQNLCCLYLAIYPTLISIPGKRLRVALPYPVASHKRNKNWPHIPLPHYLPPAVSSR